MPRTKKTFDFDSKVSGAVGSPKAPIGIKPLIGYVLVEPASSETQTTSGIYLPETSQEKPAQGTVIAIGDSIVLENGKVISAPVRIGEKVVYKKWGGDEIKIKGVEYKLVKFDDLMAIIEG